MNTSKNFDAATKINFGSSMASDERASYRFSRNREHSGNRTQAPLLERRASYLASRGKSPLWIGSPMRAPAVYTAGFRKEWRTSSMCECADCGRMLPSYAVLAYFVGVPDRTSLLNIADDHSTGCAWVDRARTELERGIV